MDSSNAPDMESQQNTMVRFFAENGEEWSSAPLVVPCSSTVYELQALCNVLMQEKKRENGLIDDDEEIVPISFRTDDGVSIIESLMASLSTERLIGEKAIRLLCLPQAVFCIRPVTRCTSSLPGHQQPVISAQFSPDGRQLASGSGDTTVRLWDLTTELPLKTCKAHTNWVLCISWSPNGRRLASACKSGLICVWETSTGNHKKLVGHKQWVTSLAWQPLHNDLNSRMLASAGRDGTIRIWDVVQTNTLRTLSGHTASVTCIRWGGCGLLYSCSQDRTIKVWRVEDGVMCRTLTGHAHWINTLALNVDYALRTSCFQPEKGCIRPTDDEAQKIAQKKYEVALRGGPERLVSGSDDFTLILWEPSVKKQEIARMTGHQQLVNHVAFSPDTRYIASASFDKSIKLWDGNTGKYITSFRGHVRAVYQISWSADSRLLVSGSADSTLKVWDVAKGGLLLDLPGHADEVFAVDWSPDGERVVSGGKDTVLKLWRR